MFQPFLGPVEARSMSCRSLGGHARAAAQHGGMLQHLSYLPGDQTGHSADRGTFHHKPTKMMGFIWVSYDVVWCLIVLYGFDLFFYGFDMFLYGFMCFYVDF